MTFFAYTVKIILRVIILYARIFDFIMSFSIAKEKALVRNHKDIYLFDEQGRVVLPRADAGAGGVNVLSLLSEKDRAFLSDASRSFEMNQFLLVDISGRPALVVRSLYSSFRLFFAVEPLFDADVIRTLADERLYASASDEYALSGKVQELSSEQILLAENLKRCFSGSSGYWTRRMTSSEVADEISRRMEVYSLLLGCDISVTVDDSVFDFEDPRKFSFNKFLYAITCFSFMAKRLALTPSLNVEFRASQTGLYCLLSFESADAQSVAECYEAAIFRRYLSFDAFPCYVRALGDRVEARCFTWDAEVDPNVKVDPRFDYKNDTEIKGGWICLTPKRL